MRSGKIFLQRLVNEWKFQMSVFKTVLDWTVIVYLVLPAIIIFSFVYRSWWLEIPEWVLLFPVGVLFFVFYIMTWIGQLRTYVHDADQMFLLKHRTLFLRLKVWAVTYSILFQGVILVCVLLLFMPFLIHHYALSIRKIVSLFFLFFSLKLLIMAVKVKIKKISTRFLQQVLTLILFIVFALLLQYVYSLWHEEKIVLLMLIYTGFIGVAGIIAIPYIKRTSEFATHVMIETMERTRYINLIFNFSYEVEKTNIVTRKRPLLFRNSQRIFKKRTPKRGFIELFVKIFIRNPLHMTGFLQMIAISSVAIIYLPPMWLKVTIFIGALLMLKNWSQLVWEKIVLSHPLMKKYREHDSYFSAKRLATNVIVVIGGVCFTIAFSLSNLLNHLLGQFFM